MSGALSPSRSLQRRQQESYKLPSALLKDEGTIAPASNPLVRTVTHRESIFDNQRCIPRRPTSTSKSPHTHYDPISRSPSVLSQTPTLASSLNSRTSMRDKVGFRIFHKRPAYNTSETLLVPDGKEHGQGFERPKSRKRFLESLWTPGSKRKTTSASQRFVYEGSRQPSQDAPLSASHHHLLAPAPTFGDVPGIGYEKPGPHIDLSSGAAARAAAAAQKELLESMRKMNLRGQLEVQDSESGIGIESGETKLNFSVPVVRKDPVATFPPEISSSIFAYLDAESVIRCELVAKSWQAVASTQHTWKRVFHSEIRPPDHRQFTECHLADEDVYPEVPWKKRWQTHKALSRRWSKGAAGAFYLEGHSDNIYCVQFDEEKIVTGSKDRTIRIWSTRLMECVSVLGVPTRRFNPNDMEGLPSDASPTPLITQFSLFKQPESSDMLAFSHDGSILCLQYDDRTLVTGSSDSTLIIWHKESTYQFRPAKRLREHAKGVLDLCFDEAHIVSCSKDNDICLWKREDGQILRKLTGHRGPVNAVKLKGDLIASASGDGLVKLWNLSSGLCIKEFSSSSRGLACVELSCDSRVIWAGGNDHEIYEFDANTGMLARRLGAHTNLVRSLHLDGNSGRLVSGSYDNNIKIINTHTHNEIANLKNWSASWILSAKADYRRIVATSQDKRVILIDFGYDLDGINALDPGSYASAERMDTL